MQSQGNSSNVTFILTACNRPDLLRETLSSFMEFNTYPIDKYWVYEDSGIKGVNAQVESEFPMVNFISPARRKGQIVALDTLYKKVKTEFVFTCEDDWRFYRPGFIEKSMQLLNADPSMLQVWLRSTSDINGHPTQMGGLDHRRVALNYRNLFHGFSFNPGLRRMADYKRLGTYGEHTTFDRNHPGNSEIVIGKIYHRLGYYATILKEPAVIHTGINRHVQ